MKKIIYIVLSVLFVILIAVFVTQNSSPITIHFLSWEFNFYGGLIIMFSFLLGVIVMSLIWGFTMLHIRQMKHHNETGGEHEKESGDTVKI